jgi:hypothetical protein
MQEAEQASGVKIMVRKRLSRRLRRHSATSIHTLMTDSSAPSKNSQRLL